MAVFDFDAYTPAQIIDEIETIGVRKAALPLRGLLLLGKLAGAHIGLGALFFVLIVSDPTLSFVASRLLGGLVFSGGLVLLVVLAIVFPIPLFVVAGFVHSVANMYLLPMGMLFKDAMAPADVPAALEWGGVLHDIVAVTLGDIAGGSLLVAAVCLVIDPRTLRRE